MSRFTTIRATYRIVTPMFCGGAGQEAELRLSSFKGALRFWWRSLQWSKVKDERELWDEEAKLFGSSDQRYGQSKVRIQFDDQPKLEPVKKVGEVFEQGTLLGAHYLGYGVMEAFSSEKSGKKAGQLTREMIPGGTFTVALRCGPSLSNLQVEEIQKALILLGTVGGLGSKSRKGFGSLTLTELSGEGPILVLSESHAERLKSIQAELSGELPTWTAFSKKTKVLQISGYTNPLKLLDKLGRELVHFRSWGNKGKVLGVDREGNFKKDHDLSKGMDVEIDHPKRVAFGLPHNYGKGDANSVQPAKLDRRASPLFFHIHQVHSEQPIGVVTFLPSLFLPEDEKLKSFGNEAALDRSDNFWTPIHGFLDRLLGTGATKKKDHTLIATEVALVQQ